MSSNFSSAAMVAVMMIVLAGCSKQPPKCSDEATFDLVRSIILGQIGGIEGASAKEIAQNMKILLPRASAFEKEIKKYSCEAKLEVGGQYELPITYASQLDDAGEHLVLVNGIGRGDLQMIQLGMVTGLKNGRPVTAPAPAPAPAVAPTPAALEPAAPAAADLMSLVGKSPFDAIKTPLLLEPVKKLLGNQYDAFKERLDVSSGVEQDGAWLIGAGGMPHSFSIEEAVFAVNHQTGALFAIIMTEGKTFTLFGATSVELLPQPLQNWYKQRQVQ